MRRTGAAGSRFPSISTNSRSTASRPERPATEEERMRKGIGIAAMSLALGAASPAMAQDATFNVRVLTPETALKAAQAALARCRTNGFQVAVAVVDRMGGTQV